MSRLSASFISHRLRVSLAKFAEIAQLSGGRLHRPPELSRNPGAVKESRLDTTSMPLKTLFARNRHAEPAEDTADRLYAAIVAQASPPAFYKDDRVPETLERRFEQHAHPAFLIPPR